MDIITQGVLGGVLAQTVARPGERGKATLIGIVAGLVADADFLIRSDTDTLLTIEYHRHFTHSLLFVPFGALIAALLFWPFMRNRLPFSRLYLYSFAGYSLSGVLDAFTSYGTHLFWPFSDERVAWHLISIVDPIFSLSLLLALLFGLGTRFRKTTLVFQLIPVFYLGLGFVQLQRAQDLSDQLAQKRGHKVDYRVVKPTLGNLVLWRSTYIANGRIYVDGIRPGITSDDKVYEGKSIRLLVVNRDLPGLDKNSVLYRDIQRFITFSDGFVAFDQNRKDVIGDIRYGMLPVSVNQLWGIRIDTSKPEQHARYRFYRVLNQEVKDKFMLMLLGRDCHC